MEKLFHWLRELNSMFKKIVDTVYQKTMYIFGLMLYTIIGLSATIGDILLIKYDEIKEKYSKGKGI